MYAVVIISGKQHRVEKGDKIRVELLGNPEKDKQVAPGASVTFQDVLLLGGEGTAKVGQPQVAGASVTATVVRHAKGPKLWAFKRKRRKGFHKTIGHRQWFSELEITGISG
ncbi:MAG: 50S ribosomal protein L21 [Deltaproteobacteria bacterium]|nr:50S ribosomal protein L21 [Deltaproteobacteria bacterium]